MAEKEDKDVMSETPARSAGIPAEDGTPLEAPPPRADEEGELSEVKKRLIYLAAEFDNYKKRVAREKDSLVSFGNERLLRAILPCLDNLERAIAQGAASGSAEALLSGVRMTYDHLLAELKKFGVEPIASVDTMFDPALHEAIAQIPWEGKPEGTVLREERKGYLLNGRLLRPAQVTVAQGPPAAPAARKGGDGGGLPGGEP